MHPLVDADGRITATGDAFVQRAGEIMDEAVAKSVSGGDQGHTGEALDLDAIEANVLRLGGCGQDTALALIAEVRHLTAEASR